MSEWDVGLFGCGTCSLCCYSYLYYGYAIAESKAMMDILHYDTIFGWELENYSYTSN